MAFEQFRAEDMVSIRHLIQLALQEDIGSGDATTQALVPEGLQASMRLGARARLVACGAGLLPLVFDAVGQGARIKNPAADGAVLQQGNVLAEVTGPARVLLAGERVALNLVQRLCGIATATAAYVQAVEGTGAVILDTRKTMPAFRLLDKYAVRAGGGQNHRMGLYDMVLIKDNHIALCGGIKPAVERARMAHLPIEVECDTLEQLGQALESGVERIMLDNMSLKDLREAVRLNAGRAQLEASGGVTLRTVRAIAATGVDCISVGALTHSVAAADIGGDIVFDPNC